jgi:DNA-binding transcriptional MocR family regulator
MPDRRFSPYGLLRGIFVPVALLEAGISHGAAMCYATLATFDKQRRGVVWPRQATVAAQLGCKERMVRNYLRELREAGLIEIRQVGSRPDPKKAKRSVGRPARISFHNPAWINGGMRRLPGNKLPGSGPLAGTKLPGSRSPELRTRARSLPTTDTPLPTVTAPRGERPVARDHSNTSEDHWRQGQREVRKLIAALNRKLVAEPAGKGRA